MHKSTISEALAAGDTAALREALLVNDVVVIFTDNGGNRAPVILTDAEDRRSVAAFSSQGALDAFSRSALVGVVPGSELADLGIRQGVDAILIDPAGPSPAMFRPQDLRDLIDGLEAQGDGSEARLRGDQDFLEPAESDQVGAVRKAARSLVPADVPAFLVDRVSGEHRVLTLALNADAGRVRAVAEALEGLIPGTLDVLRLDDAAREVLEAAAPQCRVLPR